MKKKHSETLRGMIIERQEGKGRRKEWHPRGEPMPAGKWHKSKKDYDRKAPFDSDIEDPCPSDDEELGGDDFRGE